MNGDGEFKVYACSHDVPIIKDEGLEFICDYIKKNNVRKKKKTQKRKRKNKRKSHWFSGLQKETNGGRKEKNPIRKNGVLS